MEILKNIILSIIYTFIRIITFLIPFLIIYQTFTKEETIDILLEEIISKSIENLEISNNDNTLEQYVDREDLQKYYQKFLKLYIKSMIEGKEIPDLNNEEFQALINDAADKYTAETGNPVDKSEIDKTIEESNKKLQNNPYNNILPKQFTSIFKYKVKTYHIVILIILDLLLIVLIYFIKKDLLNLTTFLFKLSLAKTIYLIIFTSGLRYLNTFGKSFMEFAKIMTRTTDTLAIIFFIISIILLIINTILSKKKKMPLPEQQPIVDNQEIINNNNVI